MILLNFIHFRSIVGQTCSIASFAVFAFVLNSCTSYIYSPAVQLSNKQLIKGEVDVKAGFGKLPETKANNVNDTYGGVVTLGYGFSKSINLYANAWTETKSRSFFYRGGVALASRIRLWEKGNSQLLLYPRISVLRNNGRSFDAMGFELPLIFLTPISPKVYTYFGIGGGYGNRRLLMDRARKNEEMYAIIGHMGVGYKPFDNLRLMLELNPICQFNRYDNRTNFILAPTLSIGYLINSPEDGGKYMDKRFKRK